MLSKKCSKNKCATREKILKIAGDLFRKYNYNSVSMNDISRKIKTTKAALYYHFRGKEDLYKELILEKHSEMQNKIEKILKLPESAENKLRKIFEIFLDVNSNNFTFASLVMQKLSKNDQGILDLVIKLRQESLDKVSHLLDELQKENKMTKIIDKELVIFLIISQLTSYALHKQLRKEINFVKWDKKEVIDQIMNFIVT